MIAASPNPRMTKHSEKAIVMVNQVTYFAF